MNVGELRAALEGLPDDLLVVQSIDPEGNGFRPTSQVEHGNSRFGDEYGGLGTVGLREVTPELREQGYTDEDISEGVDCVVLWP